MTTKCCKCAKVRVGELWTDIVKPSVGEGVSHSYCPECLRAFRREMERQRIDELAANAS